MELCFGCPHAETDISLIVHVQRAADPALKYHWTCNQTLAKADEDFSRARRLGHP